MRIAVIGTGIAGNAAAWTLSKRYPVTVYEREIRPGGHSHTVNIDYDGTPIAVDIGFIVYNELNYPDLTALFDHLGVETDRELHELCRNRRWRPLRVEGRRQNWWQTAAGLFAQPRNLLSPSYLWMLRDILTFNRQSVEDYAAGRLAGLSLGDYFRSTEIRTATAVRLSRADGRCDLVDAGADMLDFPAENFVAFFSNHRLLQYDRPVWRTVKGGSRNYVEKLTGAFRRPHPARLRGHLHRAESAWRRRHRQPWRQRDLRPCRDRRAQRSGAEDARRMPTIASASVLGAIGYSPNTIYLHRDTRLMPRRRRVWASWNFLRWRAPGNGRQRRCRDLLDERTSGHRQKQTAVRQPQPAFRTRSRAHFRQIYLRTSPI